MAFTKEFLVNCDRRYQVLSLAGDKKTVVLLQRKKSMECSRCKRLIFF